MHCTPCCWPRQEDSSRSRELVLQALEVVLAWRASTIDAQHLIQVLQWHRPHLYMRAAHATPGPNSGSDACHQQQERPLTCLTGYAAILSRSDLADVHLNATKKRCTRSSVDQRVALRLVNDINTPRQCFVCLLLQLARQLKHMYEKTKGLSDTVKGGLLAALGRLLELAPHDFAGGHGAFDAKWLLQQTGALVRSKTTPGPLRVGALAGLNSALCIEVCTFYCFICRLRPVLPAVNTEQMHNVHDSVSLATSRCVRSWRAPNNMRQCSWPVAVCGTGGGFGRFLR